MDHIRHYMGFGNNCDYREFFYYGTSDEQPESVGEENWNPSVDTVFHLRLQTIIEFTV